MGNFGTFWVILGPFGVIFGPLWAILGNFWPFLGHFEAFLDKFAENSNFFAARFGSPGPLLECMGTAFTTLILVLFIAIKAIINAKRSPVQGETVTLNLKRKGMVVTLSATPAATNQPTNQPTDPTDSSKYFVSGLKADGGVGWL